MNEIPREGSPRLSVGSPAVRPWLVVSTLSWREFIRFFRQPNRVVGAIGTPEFPGCDRRSFVSGVLFPRNTGFDPDVHGDFLVCLDY